MADVIIESQNPLDFREEDIRSLAAAISPAVSGHRIGYAYYPPSEGVCGVTWWEVARIWLPDVAECLKEEFVGAVVALAIQWARRRFKRKDAPRRPKYVAIYGPRGEILKSVAVKDDISDPEILTERDRKDGSKKMPPVQGFFDDSLQD